MAFSSVTIINVSVSVRSSLYLIPEDELVYVIIAVHCEPGFHVECILIEVGRKRLASKAH
jgi:hypothetical protein